MKLKTLSLLAGISAPLILTATSHAGFTGLSWSAKPNAFNLHVVNVYAEFDNPGGDWMQHIAGSPNNPLSINVIGGEFYNHQFGGDVAPGTALIGVFPSLAYDSFFTVGIKALAAGQTNAVNLVNMPQLAGTSIVTTNGSWACVPPTAAQANPFDPVNCFPGDGRVLLGQFSVLIPTQGPYGVTGSFLFSYVSDGSVWQSGGTFSSIVPAPGALGLLGLGPFMGRRRRRPNVRIE